MKFYIVKINEFASKINYSNREIQSVYSTSVFYFLTSCTFPDFSNASLENVTALIR